MCGFELREEFFPVRTRGLSASIHSGNSNLESVANSSVQSPSQDANSRSADHENSHLLLIPKRSSLVHKNPAVINPYCLESLWSNRGQ
jgi:hypothetical protein